MTNNNFPDFAKCPNCGRKPNSDGTGAGLELVDVSSERARYKCTNCGIPVEYETTEQMPDNPVNDVEF